MTSPAPISYADAEDICVEWLLGTNVGELVNDKVFLAMPNGSPNPSVILSRVGGAPVGRGDMPEDLARISFTVWGKTRPQAKMVAYALVSEIESLSYEGGYESTTGILGGAEVLNVSWFPDGNNARYLVDANFVVLAKPIS